MKLITSPPADTATIGSGYLLSRRTLVSTALASAVMGSALAGPSQAQEAVGTCYPTQSSARSKISRR